MFLINYDLIVHNNGGGGLQCLNAIVEITSFIKKSAQNREKALMETTCPTLGYSHLLILYKLPTLTVIILPELHHLQGAFKF